MVANKESALRTYAVFSGDHHENAVYVDIAVADSKESAESQVYDRREDVQTAGAFSARDLFDLLREMTPIDSKLDASLRLAEKDRKAQTRERLRKMVAEQNRGPCECPLCDRQNEPSP